MCGYINVNTVLLLPVGLSSKLGVILEMFTGVIPGGKAMCVGFLHHDKSYTVMCWEFSPKFSQTLLFILFPLEISTILPTHKAESLCVNIL